jgi:hypothetical protein
MTAEGAWMNRTGERGFRLQFEVKGWLGAEHLNSWTEQIWEQVFL